ARGWWMANWRGPGPANISIYVDVSTQPTVADGVVSAVDLDLDVIRLRDGTVFVDDEDEFLAHQVRFGYPAEVVAQARAAADDLVAALTNGSEVFDTAGPA